MNRYSLYLSVLLVLMAVFFDLRYQKIPNWMTFPFILTGIASSWFFSGSSGLKFSLFGLITGFFLLFFFFLLGGMGAGDVKLLSAVGSLLGPRLVFYAFVWTALTGGILAVGLIIYKKAFRQTFFNIGSLLHAWLVGFGMNSISDFTIHNRSLIKLPYAVPIAIGTILAVWLREFPKLGL